MKWIGQHIYDLVSRFRGNVYFEDVENATTDTDKFLVLGSSGKLKYRTGAEVSSDIGAGAGDITSVVAGTGLNGGATSGGATINIDANHTSITSVFNEGLGVGRDPENLIDFTSNETISFRIRNNNLLSFKDKLLEPTTDNYVGLGTDALRFSGLFLVDADISGNLTLGTDLSISNGGTGSSTASAAFTALKQNATESATGVVELATTGEADTGTDTTRVVTPAGLKSHVDARYSYQYITCSFKAQNVPVDCWMSGNENGLTEYLWNNKHGAGQTQAASDAPKDVSLSTTISVDYLDHHTAFVIPKNCVLDGFYGNCKTNGTSPNTLRPVLGLFRAPEPADGNTTDVTATCVAFDSYDTTAGNRRNRFLKVETLGLETALTQGDLLFPAAGFDATASDGNGDIWGSFTIVLKTLIT